MVEIENTVDGMVSVCGRDGRYEAFLQEVIHKCLRYGLRFVREYRGMSIWRYGEKSDALAAWVPSDQTPTGLGLFCEGKTVDDIEKMIDEELDKEKHE